MNIDLGLQTYTISGRFVYVNRDIKLVTSHFEWKCVELHI